ncbi:MAG: ATP-binding protein [Wenzhouxiangella sp.]|jgi:signal transduction histidine kinase|nr:ATP-binding protein [Wenzhouxiangella sp.]
MPLYLRIFLSFWAVILLSLSAIIVLNVQLEQAQQAESVADERVQRFAENLGRRAQIVLDQAGPTALAKWAADDQRRQRRSVVLVIEEGGSELLDRPIPRPLRRNLQNWAELDSAQLAEISRFPVHVVSNPRHGQFLLMVTPPPRPLMLRVVGPLGPWGLLLVAATFSGLICLWLARSMTRPMQELRSTGEALGLGKLDARIPDIYAKRSDELGDLARDFNRMADRLERLINGQRQLVRDISHELRSPLTRLQLALSLTERSENENDRQRRLRQMETEIQRLDDLIGQILQFSRLKAQTELPTESIDLLALLQGLIDQVRIEVESKQLNIALRSASGVEIQGNREWLQRAFENVLRNAIRHAPSNSEVIVEVTSRPGKDVEIAISDCGPGVPESQLHDIFEPFVRLSPERSEQSAGGGVGLAIALEAALRHGGQVTAQNRRPSGLRVIFTLPV